MKTLRILAVTAAVFAAGSTFAQGPSLLGDPALSLSNVSVGAEAGTTGYGVNFGYDVTPNTSLNIGWAGGSVPSLYGKSITVRGEGKFRAHYSQLSNTSIVVKYTPFTQQYLNAVNVQFGTYIQDSNIRLSDSTGTTVGKVSTGPSVKPYLGFGIAPKFDAHWGVNLDLGTIYNGKVNAVATDGSGGEGLLSKGNRWYPVAKAGVSYHF
ncbi:MAG: ornithine uptake porin CarO type 1 [Aquirhabdus sp.]